MDVCISCCCVVLLLHSEFSFSTTGISTYSILHGQIKGIASSVLAIQTDFSMAPFCMSLTHNNNG